MIHTTSIPKREEFEEKLRLNGLFNEHYDGFEATMNGTKMQSYRWYVYDISNTDLLKLLKYLHRVGTEFDYKVKILPQGSGNVIFD